MLSEPAPSSPASNDAGLFLMGAPRAQCGNIFRGVNGTEQQCEPPVDLPASPAQLQLERWSARFSARLDDWRVRHFLAKLLYSIGLNALVGPTRRLRRSAGWTRANA